MTRDDPRAVAAEILLRVDKDGSFAAAAVASALGKHASLEVRDRGLVTELVFGVLRVRQGLLSEVGRHVARGIEKVDALARTHLLLAAYQILFLDRVPAFAAVHSAVELVTQARGAKVGGFVNAVLRKVSAAHKNDADSVRERVRGETVPEWLRTKLVDSLGEETAQAFIRTTLERAPLGIRVHHASNRSKVVDVMSQVGRVEMGAHSPHALNVWDVGEAAALPGFEKEWVPQEEGSQVVALALGATPRDRVLDACAGRGHKASFIAHTLGTTSNLVLCDLHPNKLHRAKIEFEAQGLGVPQTFAVDWNLGVGDVHGVFDRIVVDAPCSGVGTIRRRPDILLRREPQSFESLHRTQVGILNRCASLLAPGGKLLFAVCSVLADECERVVAEACSDLEPCPFDAELLAPLASGATTLRLLPNVHGTDGYFLAMFQKRGPSLS